MVHHRVATRSALVYTCNQRPGYRHTPMARTVRLALSQAAQTATTSPEATESTAKKRSCDATLLGTGTNAAPPIDATHDEALPHCIAATARTESLLPAFTATPRRRPVERKYPLAVLESRAAHFVPAGSCCPALGSSFEIQRDIYARVLYHPPSTTFKARPLNNKKKRGQRREGWRRVRLLPNLRNGVSCRRLTAGPGGCALPHGYGCSRCFGPAGSYGDSLPIRAKSLPAMAGPFPFHRRLLRVSPGI